MSDEQVSSLCEQLVKAVTVMMEPASSQRYRLEALKFCEEFKEKCPFCVLCGLKLAEKTQPAIVRHFGFQIMEHVVKFRWNNMSRTEKVFLKNSVLMLMSTGTEFILVEEGHIKDVIARIVVEMVKREWPQHWPDMLMELELLSKQGETQSELVMFVLLRLAEDVVTFQTLPQQRRRDIQQTLNKSMDQIFSFMLTLLQENVNKYRRLKNDPAQELQAQSCCRVGVATLNTLAGYIDWVSMIHITHENCKILEMLCLLLNETELQVEAAECLLIAVNRKGKMEDRKPLMVLFGDVAMHYILTAARVADGESPTEKRYIFLKRLCQILCALGNQLCGLVGSEVYIETPANFSKFLDSFLDFTRHPSQFLRSTTQITWGTLFRHEVLSRDPQLLAVVPKFLRAAMTNLVKVGYPSKNDSPSCEYSRFDFDSDEDFGAFFTTFRAQQGEVLRMACRLDPSTGFQMAGEWLKYELSAPVDTGLVNSKMAAEGLCTTSSPTFIQWDAMTFFSDSVINQVFKFMKAEDIPVNDGAELLQLVLNCDVKDPLILSFVLTNVSTLFPFVKYRNEYLPQVLSKLFAAVTFETIEESKAPRTRAVKNVRRHACSSIIKICRDFSQLISTNFDILYGHVKQLLSNELMLTQMEKCALMEALVLVSNEFKNYDQQSTFLAELMAPVASLWLSEEMTRLLSSPEEFILFVGANQPLPENIMEDPTGLNRARISFCVFTILGVLRRARWPKDLNEAKSGGFLIGHMSDGSPMYRNPCTEQVLKLLPNLLAAIRTQNNLFRPEVLSSMGETFVKALDMLEVEKNSILGLPQPLLDLYDTPVYKTVLERMQGFFCTLYDNCFHILGHAGTAMQQDFYSVKDLAGQILNSAFVTVENIPDYRLRPMIRVFVKPLVLCCPAEYHNTLLIPILGPLFSYLHLRLTQRWQIINQRDILGEESSTEENPESQEMLEEQLIRLLTREVIDLIIACCVSKKGADTSAVNAEADDEEMMATEAPTPASTELSELGSCLMQHEEVSSALLLTTFMSLIWNDTIVCHKTTTQLCWPLLKQMISDRMLADAAVWFFTIVLKGLQMHGQHDVCMSALVNLAFQIYDTLRPRFIELKSVMQQVPDIHHESLDQFDAKLLAANKPSDKRKKDHFKRLIAGCIGKPLGEQFRKEVHIKNLPSLFKKLKSVQELGTDLISLSSDENNGFLTSLFQP